MDPEQKNENVSPEESGALPEESGAVPEESNAARRLRLHGDDRAEELRTAAEEAAKDERPVSWLENFWYHHKWAVIMVGAFAVIFAIAAAQLIGREKPDLYVMCAGPNYVGSAAAETVKAALQDYMGDYNGDGEKLILFADVVYAPGTANATRAKDQFQSELSAGNSSVYFLSPELYDYARETGLLVPLADVFGTVPEGAVDGCGMLLSATAFAAAHPDAAAMFPKDTVVCLRGVPMLVNVRGKEAAAKRLTFHRDFFRALVLGDDE